jgi:thiol-disulfide isomerase/thioredoxin
MWFKNRKIIVASVVGLFLNVQFATAAPIKVGDQFPDLDKFEFEGKLPDQWKGKIVIVDFWASWCGPCKASFPVMEQLHKDYGSKGLVLIGVNVDENATAMDDFLKKHPVSFAIVHDAAKKLVATANIATMPTSFVLDGERRVRFMHSGFLGEATRKLYIQQIEQLLAKP